jgi:hypothetical protein
VGKPEGKSLLGRPRLRWEDGIRLHLMEIGCRDVEWIQLVQNRARWPGLANTTMKLRVLPPRS